MKVELIYPELTNLLGENGTQLLLTKIFGEENIIRTNFPARPRFLDGGIKLAVMGAMTEAKQELILDLFLPLKEEIKNKIEEGQFLLFTGNSLDLLGQEIIHEEASTLQALGFFDFVTRVNKYDRINKFVHGHTTKGSEIFGWISQFTSYQGEKPSFIKAQDQDYGVHYKNLYATSLLGPLLITSPHFTRELLDAMDMTDSFPMEKDLLESFNKRKNDMMKNTK